MLTPLFLSAFICGHLHALYAVYLWLYAVAPDYSWSGMAILHGTRLFLKGVAKYVFPHVYFLSA
jgi:hypothetical protein